MKSILLLAIVALTFSCTFALDIKLNQQWKSWKETNNKHYFDAEEHVRLAIWKSNLKKVEEHNLQADLGVYTYWLGMNKYADMIIDEFVKVMNSYNVTMRGERSRDRDTFTFNSSLELPDTVDWRKEGLVTPVKDQGQCDAAWIFAPVGSLEGQHAKASGKLVSLSERNVIDCIEGVNCCGGGSIENTYVYIIKNHGIETEAGYPSYLSLCQCHFDPTKSGATMTGFTDIKSRDENALQQAVATVGPITVAIDASHASFQLYRSGVYNDPACSQTQLDHSALIVGYGTDSGQPYWLVKNSWGASWGEQGYILMSRNKNNQCGIATAASYPLV